MTTGQSPTWKAITGVLVSIVLGIGGYAFGTTISDVKSEINTLKEKKLDKEQYQSDIQDIKKKVDKIYEWHLPHDLRK